METYAGKFNIQFNDLPSIELKTIEPEPDARFLKRLAVASKRRVFYLTHDWEIDLDNVPYQPELNGTIQIPATVNGERLEFDGASIPFPWLVSLLTIGVLRPLGVMLLGSIIHDFAFKYGYLLVSSKDQPRQKVFIERHIADALLRDIIATFNKMPSIAIIGWLFVRFGWIFVKYNNRRFGGRPPYWQVFLILAVFAGFAYLLCWNASITIAASSIVYFTVYLTTLLRV
jgi:hypothetical protein